MALIPEELRGEAELTGSTITCYDIDGRTASVHEIDRGDISGMGIGECVAVVYYDEVSEPVRVSVKDEGRPFENSALGDFIEDVAGGESKGNDDFFGSLGEAARIEDGQDER